MFKPGDRVVCVKPKEPSPFGRGLSKGSVYIVNEVTSNGSHVSLKGVGGFMFKRMRFVLQKDSRISFNPKNKPYIET